MNIEMFDGNLTKADITQNTMQIGCRGVILHKDQILVVYEEKWDMTTLPGGRLEPGETYEQCVVREIKEETGVIVENPVHTVTVIEHYEGHSFTSVYFLCDFVEETNDIMLTELEKAFKLRKKWMTIENLMDELANNPTTFEYGVNVHNREFLGLINSL